MSRANRIVIVGGGIAGLMLATRLGRTLGRDGAARVTLVPRGPARLYTWQSRRIRLFRSGGRVSGCLIANGDNDRMVPSVLSEDLHRRIVGSELIIYPNSGHGGVFQYWQKFAPIAAKFLTD